MLSTMTDCIDTSKTIELNDPIDALNLDDIVQRVKKLKCWNEDQANLAEKDYRLFLKLVCTYPEENLVLSEAVKAIWDAHVLYNRQCLADCDMVYRQYVLYQPFYNTKVVSEKTIHRTIQLFQLHFGEIPKSYQNQYCHGGIEAYCNPK